MSGAVQYSDRCRHVDDRNSAALHRRCCSSDDCFVASVEVLGSLLEVEKITWILANPKLGSS